MNKLKIFSAISVIVVIFYFIKFPIIIDQNIYSGKYDFGNLRKGEIFSLKEKIKIKDYKNCHLIFIVNDRNDVADEFKYGKVFTTHDQTLIKRFITAEFIFSESDVATAQNEILLYQNNQCVFRTSIISDGKSEGLQSVEFGWIKSKKSKEISEILIEFDNNYLPVVQLK